MPHLIGQAVELRIEFGALVFDCGELAGQHHAQLGAHLVAQARVALGLRSLALQRIHLSRDFFEDVVHARQVELGIFEARFGETLLRLEFGDARSLFENGAAISRTAAQDLPNASLLDHSVGLRPKPGSHEQFLNVAQAAELAVQQVFAVARAEQAARDHDLSRVELLLVELATANFQNHVRRDGSHRCVGGAGR